MDLNKKGKSWVGNIYHQFESICQDVDDFMSKETVKFVENQVQSVGVSVKRFYSDVVQDILPPFGDEVKHEEESLTDIQGDTRDHTESTRGIRAPPAMAKENQLSVEQGPIDTLRNSSAAIPSELDQLTQYTEPTCADPSEESIADLPLREFGAKISNNEYNDIDEDITRDLIPKFTDSSSKENFFVICDDNHKDSTLPNSPGLSDTAEILTISNDRFSCHSFSDDMESGWLFESELAMFEELNFNETRSLSPPPVASANKAHKEYNLPVDSVYFPGFDSRHSDDGINCDSIKDGNFDVSSTYFSCNNEQAELGFVSSSYSTSPKFYNTLESASANINRKAESLFSSHIESKNSTPSFAITAYDIKAMDILPALLLESNAVLQTTPSLKFPANNSTSVDANASVIHGPISIVGQCQSSKEHGHEDAQFKSAIFPSETGNLLESDVDIADLNMETIDLTTDVKHEATGNFTHPAFHGRRNFRYYKKLVKDALTSRKRLSKEYEHLAIWYGDIEMESRQLFEPGTLPSLPITSLHAARTPPLHETGESEWELL